MGCRRPLSAWGRVVVGAGLESGLWGAHRQNAWPVLVGDQGRDQAQCGRRRVLLGRGGGAHGRTSARPSQGVRPRCRPCSAVPCLVRSPGCARPAGSAGASRPGAGGGGGVPCAGSPAAGGRTISHEATVHVDPHAIVEEGPRRSTGSCCPHGVGRARVPHHQPPTLPGRHRRRTGQLPPRHPRLPHPTRGIHPTHCHHPLTPPTASLNRAQGAPSPPLAL